MDHWECLKIYIDLYSFDKVFENNEKMRANRL